MTYIVYTRFLNLTSELLNFCVRHNLWWFAAKIINFRKLHIAKKLRTELISIH